MRAADLCLGAAVVVLATTAATAQAPSDSVSVAISRSECEYLMRHRPAPDVAYKPGVDVRGKPVVPADRGGLPPLHLPDNYTFVVSRTIAGLPGGVEVEMAIGEIEYDIDSGRMTFNGQPLTDPMADELVAHCQAVLAKNK